MSGAGWMLEACQKLHPKPKSITELKKALQVNWDSLTQVPINKAVSRGDAQKLTVNNSSTQSDCQTSDIIVKYRYLKRKHCVV